MAQITSGFKVSKQKLEDLIEVWGRVKLTRLSPSNLEMTKLRLADPENFEVFVIEYLTDTDLWRPLVEYLENPIGSTDQKVKYRSLSYVIKGN